MVLSKKRARVFCLKSKKNKIKIIMGQFLLNMTHTSFVLFIDEYDEIS